MNRSAFLGVVVGLALIWASCSQQGPGQTQPSGGSGGSATGAGGTAGSGSPASSLGGASGSGGVTGRGGESSGGATVAGGATSGGGTSSASGGTIGTGGRTTSSGGATGSGGTVVSGGTTGTATNGGTTGTGGSLGSGGAAGSSARGGTTGNGGAGSGGAASAGATGSGGRATGGATPSGGTTSSGGTTGATTTSNGGSGSGGSTAAGGSTGALNPADIVPDLVGFYWEGTCVGTRDPGGHNCPLDDKGSSCPTGATYDQQGVIRDKVFNVKGTSGQKYTINFEVAGVIGTRCYTGGTRASSAAPSDSGYNNWWYVGGTQYNNSIWNTYELHVSPSTGDASKDVYYFNAADNPGGSYCEREASYLAKYTASFKALGGGTLTFRIHDSNCQAQQNCGSDTVASDPCTPRSVDLSGMSPQPPTSFKQPPSNVLSKTYYPQWLWLTVTSVTSP